MSWANCQPPIFAGVRPTNHLSIYEALQLARDTVWRCFRITLMDPAKGAPFQIVTVPGYTSAAAAGGWGKLQRRQQIILTPTKVDQIVPGPRVIPGAVNLPVIGDPAIIQGGAALGQGILPEFYNGYSRDQAAVVYGSVSWKVVSKVWYFNRPMNTDPAGKVYVGFEIDPVEQVVTFGQYIYASGGAGPTVDFIKAPTLVLETGVHITDPDSGEFLRYINTLGLNGIAPMEWEVHQDVQAFIVGNYDANHKLLSASQRFKDEADNRAAYYLAGMAAKYQLNQGKTRQYAGIIPIDLDGACQQVTWSVGPAGPTTTASLNLEHDYHVQPYPPRRLDEALPLNKAAAAANAVERAEMEADTPKAKG